MTITSANGVDTHLKIARVKLSNDDTTVEFLGKTEAKEAVRVSISREDLEVAIEFLQGVTI